MATVSWKSIGKHNSFELADEDDPETQGDFDDFTKWLAEQEGEEIIPATSTSAPDPSCEKCHKKIKECSLDNKLKTINSKIVLFIGLFGKQSSVYISTHYFSASTSCFPIPGSCSKQLDFAKLRNLIEAKKQKIQRSSSEWAGCW